MLLLLLRSSDIAFHQAITPDLMMATLSCVILTNRQRDRERERAQLAKSNWTQTSRAATLWLI